MLNYIEKQHFDYLNKGHFCIFATNYSYEVPTFQIPKIHSRIYGVFYNYTLLVLFGFKAN